MKKTLGLFTGLLLVISHSSAEDVSTSDCLSYWQLRSVGLSREYGIASAKLSDRYNRQYQAALSVLKTESDPQTLVAQTYKSMALLMSKIDNDYERTAELDGDYLSQCPLGSE